MEFPDPTAITEYLATHCTGRKHVAGCRRDYPRSIHRLVHAGPCAGCGGILQFGDLNFQRASDGKWVGLCCNPYH